MTPIPVPNFYHDTQYSDSYWLLTSPNDKVNKLLRKAKAYGTSKASTLERYTSAPLKALGALTISLTDVVAYPMSGLYNASVNIVDLSIFKAAESIIIGVVNGARSMYQVALIATTIVMGIIMPPIMYAALPAVQTMEKILNAEINGLCVCAKDKKVLSKLEKLGQEIDSLVSELKQREEIAKSEVARLAERLKIASQEAEKVQTLERQLRETQEAHKATLKELQEQLLSARAEASKVPQLQFQLEEVSQEAGKVQTLERQLRETQEAHKATLKELQQQLLLSRAEASKVSQLQAQLEEASQEAGKVQILEHQLQETQEEHKATLKELQEQLLLVQEEANKVPQLQSQLKTALEDASQRVEETVKNLKQELQETQQAQEAALKQLKEQRDKLSDIKTALTTEEKGATFKTEEALAIFKYRREYNGLLLIIKSLAKNSIHSLKISSKSKSGKLLVELQRLREEKKRHEEEISALKKNRTTSLELAATKEKSLNVQIAELKAELQKKGEMIKKITGLEIEI